MSCVRHSIEPVYKLAWEQAFPTVQFVITFHPIFGQLLHVLFLITCGDVINQKFSFVPTLQLSVEYCMQVTESRS